MQYLLNLLKVAEAKCRIRVYLSLVKRNEKVGVSNLSNTSKYYTAFFLGAPKPNHDGRFIRIRIADMQDQSNPHFPRIIKVKNLQSGEENAFFDHYDVLSLAQLSISELTVYWKSWLRTWEDPTVFDIYVAWLYRKLNFMLVDVAFTKALLVWSAWRFRHPEKAFYIIATRLYRYSLKSRKLTSGLFKTDIEKVIYPFSRHLHYSNGRLMRQVVQKEIEFALKNGYLEEVGFLHGSNPQYAVTANLWHYLIQERTVLNQRKSEKRRDFLMVLSTIVLAIAAVIQVLDSDLLAPVIESLLG